MGCWRDKLIDIEPYTPGEQLCAPGLIKLNTNENPFPPSPAVREAARRFDPGTLVKYPDPDAGAVAGAVAEAEGIREEDVIVGNGSDEVLAFAFRAFFNADRPVLFPDVTYTFYPVWCGLFGIAYREVPLSRDLHLLADDYRGDNGGVVIANPNAPTGIAEGEGFFREILEANPDSVVIADEAYVGFGARSVLPLIGEYENLFVVRTFSKSHSLAGLRLGFGCGSPDLVSAVKAVKNSFNSYTVGGFALAVGAAAARSGPYYREQAAKVARIRDDFAASLRGMGFDVPDSSANFVFAAHPDADAGRMYAWLKARGILVRWFARPRIADRLRISIGREEEMDALLEALRAYLEGDHAI